MENQMNRRLAEIMELTDKLIHLVDTAEQDGADDQCSVLLGIARDCAYKLRLLAEQELKQHALRESYQAARRGDGELKGAAI